MVFITTTRAGGHRYSGLKVKHSVFFSILKCSCGGSKRSYKTTAIIIIIFLSYGTRGLGEVLKFSLYTLIRLFMHLRSIY